LGLKVLLELPYLKKVFLRKELNPTSFFLNKNLKIPIREEKRLK